MNFCTHIFTQHKKYKKSENPSLSRIKPIAGFKSTLTRKTNHPRFLSEWTLGSKTLITEPLRNWCLNKTSSYFYHAGLSLLCSLFTHLRQLTKDRRHTPCNSAQLPLLLHRRSVRAGASNARVCGFGRASSKGPSRRVPTAARGGVARAKPAFVVPRGARGGRGGPRLARLAATTSPRRVAPRSPRARANPPSCSACPARLAPNPAGTPYPGFPKTCWQGPRPSAGTRPSPRPPPHPLHPRRLLPLRDRRPLPRPWSPSVVSTAQPGPRGVSRSHPRARARRCYLLLLAPPNQPPSGVEAQSRPF